jgi:hypothetical protein
MEADHRVMADFSRLAARREITSRHENYFDRQECGRENQGEIAGQKGD